MKRVVRAGRLSQQVFFFCRFLRQQGFSVGIDQALDILRSCEQMDITRPDVFKHILRVHICHSPEEIHVFERWYPHFFQFRVQQSLVDVEFFAKQAASDTYRLLEQVDEKQNRITSADYVYANQEGGDELKHGAAAEAEQKQGSQSSLFISEEEHIVTFSSEDKLTWQRVAATFLNSLKRHRSRKFKLVTKGRYVHMRQTMRRMAIQGWKGDVLSWQDSKSSKTKLVIFMDGSRSMQPFIGPVLDFVKALCQLSPHVEVFVFSTYVRRIISLLRAVAHPAQTGILAIQGREWAGGTRIGYCLTEWMNQYQESLHSRPSLFIISDGLDTGEPEVMRQALERLKLRIPMLLWLNPLLGLADYQPQAMGMKTALSYIDLFCHADDPHSFLKLALMLQHVSRRTNFS